MNRKLRIKFTEKNAKVQNQIRNSSKKERPYYELYISPLDPKKLNEKFNIVKREIENASNTFFNFKFNITDLKDYINKVREFIIGNSNLFEKDILERVNENNLEKILNFQIEFSEYSQGRLIAKIHLIDDGILNSWNNFEPFWSKIIGGITILYLDFSTLTAFLEFEDSVYNILLENYEKDNQEEENIKAIELYLKRESKVRDSAEQSKLRKALLKKYSRCQICEITLTEMLVASHIVDLKYIQESKNANLFKFAFSIDNALLLCSNHDKMFDRKLFSIDEDGKIFLTNKINQIVLNSYEQTLLPTRIQIFEKNNNLIEMIGYRNNLL